MFLFYTSWAQGYANAIFQLSHCYTFESQKQSIFHFGPKIYMEHTRNPNGPKASYLSLIFM